jgi:hypothetical protein
LRVVDLAQEGGDVDAAVHGRERAEPAGGLLELAGAADLVSPARLVPRDDDVHEPLEEILLLGLGRTPGVLERLVRGEVLTGAGEVEAALEISRDRP